jgi:hypothetical protein
MDGEYRYTIGYVTVADDKIEFLPPGTKRPPSAAPAGPGLFVRGDGGWAGELHPFDRFLKNTYEILSPLNEITSRVTMTRHEFLSSDRKARRSVFGEGAGAVEVTVNMGMSPLRVTSKAGGEVVLGLSGFMVEGPAFLAFSAQKFGGLEYTGSSLFTVRSLDGKPITESANLRIYHGFGDPRIRIAGTERRVEKEEIITAK